jgi:hypothetical protein
LNDTTVGSKEGKLVANGTVGSKERPASEGIAVAAIVGE